MSRCSSFLWRRTRGPLFLLVAFTVAICKAQSEGNYTPLDSTVELDLVFPQPNETYKRAYPFPLIFAFQGMQNGWPHHLKMDWYLAGESSWNDDPEYSSDHGTFPSNFHYELNERHIWEFWTGGKPPGGQDTIFFTAGARNILNSTATSFRLQFSLSFHYNCSLGEKNNEAGFRRHEPYLANGYVSFQVGDDGLEPAAALPEDQCATGLQTVRLKGSLDVPGPYDHDPPCAVLDEEDLKPEPEPCRVKPPSGLSSSVSSCMMFTAECTTGSWPAETLIAPCGHDMWLDDDSGASLVYPFSAATIAGITSVVSVWIG